MRRETQVLCVSLSRFSRTAGGCVLTERTKRGTMFGNDTGQRKRPVSPLSARQECYTDTVKKERRA